MQLMLLGAAGHLVSIKSPIRAAAAGGGGWMRVVIVVISDETATPGTDDENARVEAADDILHVCKAHEPRRSHINHLMTVPTAAPPGG